MFDGQEWAAILTATAGLATAVLGGIALLRRKTPGEKEAQRSASAVSDIVRTKEQVETLVSVVADLQSQLLQLKAQAEVDRDKIKRLEDDLETERGEHAETRRLLVEAKRELSVKNGLILDLQRQLSELQNRG